MWMIESQAKTPPPFQRLAKFLAVGLSLDRPPCHTCPTSLSKVTCDCESGVTMIHNTITVRGFP
jgi:hypothetical protein